MVLFDKILYFGIVLLDNVLEASGVLRELLPHLITVITAQMERRDLRFQARGNATFGSQVRLAHVAISTSFRMATLKRPTSDSISFSGVTESLSVYHSSPQCGSTPTTVDFKWSFPGRQAYRAAFGRRRRSTSWAAVSTRPPTSEAICQRQGPHNRPCPKTLTR